MIDIAIVAIYMIGILIIGLVSGLKIKDFQEYSRSKNSFPLLVMVAAIFATMVGGGSTMGVSQKVFSTGSVFFLLCICSCLRDLLAAFFLVPKFGQFDKCLSTGDIMEMFYGRPGKILVGIAGLLHGTIVVSMQVAAMGHLMNYFLHIPYSLAVVIGMGVVALYSSFGGIRAVTITDVVQFAVMIIAIPVTFTMGMEMVGGFSGLIAALPSEKLHLLPNSADAIRIYSLMLVFAMPYLDATLVQRLLMGRNVGQVKRAMIITSCGRLPYYIMVGLLGLVAFVLEPSLQADLALPYLVNTILPEGIKGFVIVGLLAVIMSTADSDLHVNGLLLTHDLIKPLSKKPLTDQQELFIARSLTALLGCLSVIGALYNNNIIELFILAQICWMPVITIPLIAGIFGVRASVRVLFTSAACGIGTYLFWEFLLYESTHVDSSLPAVIASALTFYAMYALERSLPVRARPLGQTALVKSSFRFLITIKKTLSLISRVIGRVPRYFEDLADISAQKVEVFGAPYGYFVLFSVTNLCIVPLIFTTGSGQMTQGFVLYLRTLASILSFLLVMKDFWPRKTLRYLPVYWHFTLIFCLPYFSISMCLFTSVSIEWLIDLVLTIFILGVLVDWKTYVSMIFAGGLLAILTFVIFADWSQFNIDYSNVPIMSYALVVSLAAGALFSRNKEGVLLEKLAAFKALGGTIAHEMRTPLSSIHVSASGLKDCLPALVDGYQQARAAGLKVPRISQLALESVANVPERMRYICASSLNIIDMLLLQLRDKDWSAHFSNCHIKDCVETALNEYCFRENERALVDISGIENFKFYGNRYLVIHILYNLMRNAFTFIQSEKRGFITMWTSESPNDYILHFCDTAKGINVRDLPHIFEQGFSKRSGGSGVGLHYCRRMMTTMQGNITVKSVEGKFCEFMLSFPKDGYKAA